MRIRVDADTLLIFRGVKLMRIIEWFQFLLLIRLNNKELDPLHLLN
jgi:hypothetical protein